MSTPRIAGESILIDRHPFGSTPKTGPVDSARLKLHIQVNHSPEDDLITGVGGQLDASRDDIESRGQVSLINQKRQLILDTHCWPTFRVALTYGPVRSVTSVSYLDKDDATQTLPTTNWRTNVRSNPIANAFIEFYGTLPTLSELSSGVIWIDYEAGHGTATSDVPGAWQSCVLVHAHHLYERREGMIGGGNDAAYERMLKRKIQAAGGITRFG